MEKPIYEPWKFPFPPETSTESMEFLSRSWSVSAQEVSKAISPSHIVFPKSFGGGSFAGDCVAEESSAELDDAGGSIATVSGNPFSFATSETSQLVMNRIMFQSQEASPRTSGRLSCSEPLNGSLTESPPVSPSYLDPVKIRSAANIFRATPPGAGGSYGYSAVVPTGRTMGRWLKDRKEKKKKETRAQNAQIHASVSVAGVAAAVAAMATATATATATSSTTSKDDQTIKTTMAVASAATLVAAQCVEAAEAMGADREHLASVVNSAVNVRSAGDVMTLTAAAATALRGAATLKARALKDVWNVAAVIPVDKGGGATSNGSSHGSPSGEIPAEENFIGACNRELLARGCELLKRTRKGDLHWKVVSVYINRDNQVMLKMKSRHIAGTVTKKKKNVVLEVIKDMPAWPGRFLLIGGENRRYFGLKTVSRGVVEFECMNQRQYEMWTGGVSRLLEFADTRKL